MPRIVYPLIIFCALIIAFVTLPSRTTEHITSPILEAAQSYAPSAFKFKQQGKSIAGLRVAVIEQTSYHDEVIGAVLNVLDDIQANVTFYRNELFAGFEDVIADVRDLKTTPPLHTRFFADDVNSGKYDVAVLVTGDKKFWAWRDKEIQAWTDAKHMHLIVILHEIEYFGADSYDQRLILYTAASEGRLTLVSLSEHGAEMMRGNLRSYIEDRGESGWEGVEVLDFAPTFRVAQAAKAKSNMPKCIGGSNINRACILGRMNPLSRDYDRILKELAEAITEDPELWGYKSIPVTRPHPDGNGKTIPSHRFVPLNDPKNPPFTMNLIGKDEGKLNVPPELVDTEGGSELIVVMHSDGSYTEFYNTIGAMDIILPAFKNELYIEYRASAAVASAVIAETPLLTTPKTLSAYPYLSSPAYRLQPPSLSEIDTLGLLRRGIDPWTASGSDGSAPLDPFYGSKRNPKISWGKYISDLSVRNGEKWLGVLRDVVEKKESTGGRELVIENMEVVV